MCVPLNSPIMSHCLPLNIFTPNSWSSGLAKIVNKRCPQPPAWEGGCGEICRLSDQAWHPGRTGHEWKCSWEPLLGPRPLRVGSDHRVAGIPCRVFQDSAFCSHSGSVTPQEWPCMVVCSWHAAPPDWKGRACGCGCFTRKTGCTPTNLLWARILISSWLFPAWTQTGSMWHSRETHFNLKRTWVQIQHLPSLSYRTLAHPGNSLSSHVFLHKTRMALPSAKLNVCMFSMSRVLST